MGEKSGLSYGNYYRAFIGARGFVAAVATFAPLASDYVLSGRVFPPLGDQSLLLKTAATALAMLVTFFAYRARGDSSGRISRLMIYLAIASFVFVCGYYAAQFGFVRRVDIPSEERSEYVSVGLTRSQFAQRKLSDLSDVDVLKTRGFSDSAIRENWTPASIFIARLLLFITFCGATLPFVGVLSLAILEHARQVAGEEAIKNYPQLPPRQP